MRRADGAQRNRFYATRRWALTRRHKLGLNPFCEHCGVVLANEVHHDPPLAVLLATGRDPYALEVLVALCKKCHSRATVLEQRTG